MVNLTPLFQWWTAHSGGNPAGAIANEESDRPLSAWKRITGVKVAVLESGWVVQAQIASSPTTQTNERIFLQNPPALEEQQFYGLKALLPQYNQQITNDARKYQADINAENKEKAYANADARSRYMWNRVHAGSESRRAARERETANAVLADQKKYEQMRDAVQKQLNAIPHAEDRYQIDCFAMEIRQNRQGLPVFDMGATTQIQ